MHTLYPDLGLFGPDPMQNTAMGFGVSLWTYKKAGFLQTRQDDCDSFKGNRSKEEDMYTTRQQKNGCLLFWTTDSQFPARVKAYPICVIDRPHLRPTHQSMQWKLETRLLLLGRPNTRLLHSHRRDERGPRPSFPHHTTVQQKCALSLTDA